MAGRPRKTGSDAAIMAAALELLRERGYAGLTLDDVADRAGVGKSSLYRRFRDRAVETDLGHVGLGVIASLLGHDPHTLAMHRARVIEPRARHSRQLLADALQRGEIRPGTDLDAAMELLIGSLFTRALTGDRSPCPWPERAVDTILAGLQPGQDHAGARLR